MHGYYKAKANTAVAKMKNRALSKLSALLEISETVVALEFGEYGLGSEALLNELCCSCAARAAVNKQMDQENVDRFNRNEIDEIEDTDRLMIAFNERFTNDRKQENLTWEFSHLFYSLTAAKRCTLLGVAEEFQRDVSYYYLYPTQFLD